MKKLLAGLAAVGLSLAAFGTAQASSNATPSNKAIPLTTSGTFKDGAYSTTSGDSGFCGND